MSFLELKPGANYIRILTVPYQYICHDKFIPKESSHYGMRLKCPYMKVMEEGLHVCELCEKGDRSKPRWVIGVISRLDNNFYWLNVNWKIFSGIRDLARHPHWGDPKEYDLDINLEFNYDSIEKVNVIAITKKPLSAQDELIKEYVDESVIKQLTEPPDRLYPYEKANPSYNFSESEF